MHRHELPLLLIATAALLAGCASDGSGAGPASAGGAPPAAEAASPDETGAPAPAGADADARKADPEPATAAEEPDGESTEWLVDDQGRQYTTKRYPKYEGHYLRLESGKVQFPRGFRYDVAEEGEDYFLVKLYRVGDEAAPGEPSRPSQRPMAELAPASDRELARAEDLAEVDALTFQPFDRGLPTEGQWRNGFAVVDFDGDGHVDVVHGPARKGSATPWVFLGDGAGSWRQLALGERLPADLRLDYGDIAVADFDRDGRLDLALGVHLRGVVVLVDDGEGGLRRWSDGLEYASIEDASGPGFLTSRGVAALDWDGDGWTDLAVLGEGSRLAVRREDAAFRRGATDVVVYRNVGDGTWEPLPLDDKQRLRGDSLAVADLDGDGRPDLVTSWMNSAAPLPLVLNRGTGEGDGVPAAIRPLPDLPENTLVPAVAVEDFDGDGRADVAITAVGLRSNGPWHGIFVYLAREEGWLRRPVLELEGRRQIRALAAGRLPGDEHADLVAFDGEGGGWAFLGAGDGSFRLEAAPELAPPESGCSGYHVELVDLDGRPGDEIVASFAGEPGGEVMLDPTAPLRCRNEGRLAAWRAEIR